MKKANGDIPLDELLSSWPSDKPNNLGRPYTGPRQRHTVPAKHDDEWERRPTTKRRRRSA